VPGAATSRLVCSIHPLGNEPLGGGENRRGQVAFEQAREGAREFENGARRRLHFVADD
jgi:hypothetical protein